MSNEYRFIILAKDKYDFAAQLNSLTQCAYDEIFNEEKYMIVTQMKDAEPFQIVDYIRMNFAMSDEKYRYKGKFIRRPVLYEKIKPYCKEVSISCVPKNFGDTYSQYQDGYCKEHFGQVNVEIMKPFAPFETACIEHLRELVKVIFEKSGEKYTTDTGSLLNEADWAIKYIKENLWWNILKI